MKNLIIIALFMFGGLSSGFGQVNPNAIGVRGGGGSYGNGFELSYQKGIGEGNRLELDLGLRGSSYYNHFVFTGIYHWVKNITSGLNWYIGPGAQIGSYNYKNNSSYGFSLAVGGQLGLEFDFSTLDIPLLISIDTRPMWGFIRDNNDNGFNYGGNLAFRYLF